MSRGSPISQWWDFEKTSNNDKYHHYMENAQKWRKQAIFHWKYLYFHQYLVKLRTVVNFGLIFIILFKLNGKQLCKKILFMKNKCGSINDHNNIWHWNRHMSKFAILNLSCLLESVVLWRHLVAIKRQGDIRLTFVADNRPMALLSNRRIVETSTPSLLAIYFYVTSLYILVDDEYIHTYPLLFKSFIKVEFIHVDRFTNLCSQLIDSFNHSLGCS